MLLDRVPLRQELEVLLRPLGVVARTRAGASQPWMAAAETLHVPYRPEVNGHVLVDVVPEPWPDALGGEDPKTSPVFAAWATGWLPGTYPGALSRAVQQAHLWPDAKAAATTHRAHVRVRLSYALGAAPGAPLVPEQRSPAEELAFVVDVLRELVRLPGTLAAFFPAGEALRAPAQVALLADEAEERGGPPLPLWSNVRAVRLAEAAGWTLWDTVGMQQLELPDLEAAQPASDDAPALDGFLRDVQAYLCAKGNVVQDGNTLSGPGGTWRAFGKPKGVLPPPRPILRLLLQDGPTPPPIIGISGTPD